jgi:hypothetical protein
MPQPTTLPRAGISYICITNYIVYTDQAEVAVTLGSCTQEVIGSNLVRNIGYPEAFRGFLPEKCCGSTSDWARMAFFHIISNSLILL